MSELARSFRPSTLRRSPRQAISTADGKLDVLIGSTAASRRRAGRIVTQALRRRVLERRKPRSTW